MNLTKAYDSYKFSEYFKTEIPLHWEMKPLVLVAKQDRNSFVDGPFGSDLKTTDYQDDGIPLIQLNNIRGGKHFLQNIKFVTENKKNELIRHVACSKDVVIAKMAEPVARAAVVSDDYPEYVIVADCVKLTPNLDVINLDYLVWAINSDSVRFNAELVSTGTTRIRINLGELRKLKIPYPSLPEQLNISAFLDHETTKIDNLIEKQQQLIELLKEKRQAVISHAVTKGLNPDVPMKDSGVEWLGEVPEHWFCTSLKHIANVIDCKHITAEFSDVGIPVASISEVKKWFVDLSTAKLTNEKYYLSLIDGGRKPLVGDIIYSRNATVGEAAIVGDGMPEFAMGQDVCLIKTKEKITPEFILYTLKSKAISQQLNIAMIGSTFKRINVDDIRNFSIAIPPEEEQNLIFNMLSVKLEKYDQNITNAEIAIQLMQERRTALISAAVTGKIDVRDWVAPDTQNIEEPQEATA